MFYIVDLFVSTDCMWKEISLTFHVERDISFHALHLRLMYYIAQCYCVANELLMCWKCVANESGMISFDILHRT